MLALGPDICCMARLERERERWIVRHTRAAAGCDGNGWSKSTFTKRPPLMFASTAVTPEHDIRKGWAEKRILKIELSELFWSRWLRNVERRRGASVADFTNFYEIPDCCFEAHDINHGNIAPFSPLVAKKDQFPSHGQPWIPSILRSLPARMQFFCCKPEVTCPKDSYVTASCKSLLNTLAN